MIAVSNPAAGLIDALNRLAETPGALAGFLVIAVLAVSAALLIRFALR